MVEEDDGNFADPEAVNMDTYYLTSRMGGHRTSTNDGAYRGDPIQYEEGYE